MFNTRFDITARGRRSLALDLKQPRGVAAALALIGKAGALIEGFRAGVMERLGLGPGICLQQKGARCSRKARSSTPMSARTFASCAKRVLKAGKARLTSPAPRSSCAPG